MAHKFPNVLVHIIFSTKDRRSLVPDNLRPTLSACGESRDSYQGMPSGMPKVPLNQRAFRRWIPEIDFCHGLLWKYLAGIGRNHKIHILAVGGTANHVHLLIALPTDVTVAKAVQVLKANSSRWISEHGIVFTWQEGYGAFSVSASHGSVVQDYIRRQPEHHARRSYEDEFLTLLRKTGVGFEPDQVFG